MNNPHPWRPDPSDRRIPIGAPDTISRNPPGSIRQVRQDLAVENRDDICRPGALAAILRTCIFLRFLDEPVNHVLRQTEKGLPVHSVHRFGADGTQTALIVPDQTLIDTQDMFVCGVQEGFVGKVDSALKELIGFFIVHGTILKGIWLLRHS